MFGQSKFSDGLKSILSGQWIPKPKNVPKTSVVVNHVTVRPPERKTQDIENWRNALRAAEGMHQQKRQLFDLYDEIMLDGFLAALVDKRIAKITNVDLVFAKKGKRIDAVADLAKRTFFAELLYEALQARFWGHSLIQMDWAGPTSPNESKTVLIPRRHVKPRLGIVTANSWDLAGIEYRQSPYSDYTLEIGKSEDLGILLRCCPLVIFKRGNFGDWAEFVEVFGMPFRWATYNNEQSRELLVTALEQAGSAGYLVAPEDAKINFENPTNGQGSDVFRFLREAMNEELSITVLGNSMTTTEAKSSGYAQSVTHEKSQAEVHKDDRKFVIRFLNEKLTPFLEKIGFDTAGGEWSFQDEDSMSMTEKLDIALKVDEKVAIGEDYWYDTFKIPKPSPAELAKIEAKKAEAQAAIEAQTKSDEAKKPEPSKPAEKGKKP